MGLFSGKPADSRSYPRSFRLVNSQLSGPIKPTYLVIRLTGIRLSSVNSVDQLNRPNWWFGLLKFDRSEFDLSHEDSSPIEPRIVYSVNRSQAREHGMYLFGADSERNPISGCATYKTDLVCGRIPGHMAECLKELLCSTTYRDLNVGADITIQSLRSHGAYLATGEYVGTGLPVYQVYFETDTMCYDHMVRATSRKELRAALKLLYPHCKVGI